MKTELGKYGSSKNLLDRFVTGVLTVWRPGGCSRGFGFVRRAGVMVLAALTAASANSTTLELRGKAGGTYVIEVSDDLQKWTPLKEALADAAGRLSFSDPSMGTGTRRFYRATSNLRTASVRQDRVLVKPKTGVTLSSLSTLNARLGVTRLNTFSRLGNLQVVRPSGWLTGSALIETYRQSGLVEYAEPDYIVHTHVEPNDARFRDTQWSLNNTGQFEGTVGADISALEAWDAITSAANIIVAVPDTGVRYTHEDLSLNMWVNPAEIPGNGLDDDGNGFVDDVHGINTLNNGGNPNDDHGHGTHVAGIIGATANNGTGIAGVCWRVQIMALKFIDATGNGSVSDAIRCIEYARSKGAHVINASWGANEFTSQALQDAIAAARDAGIIFVASCGNDAGNNDNVAIYPASYDLDNVISVAATTQTDDLASFSNFGATTVDLAAPGTPILSCGIGSDSDYQFFDGTSMAAAHVSGVVALLRAFHPNENYQQIIDRMLEGVDPLSALAGKCATGGRLNAQRAINPIVLTLPAVTVSASDADASEAGDPGVFTVTRTGSTATDLTVNYTVGGSATSGTDYAALSGSVTIASGSSSASVTVAPIDDSAVEGSETVILTLSDNAAYTVGTPGSATVNIAADDSDLPVISLSEADPNASEAGPDAGVIFFNRTGDTSQTIQLSWTFSGTAQNGVDFPEFPTSGDYPAGLSEADFTITPIDDSLVEGSETIVITLVEGPGYRVGTPNTATITIADNDQPPTLPTVTVAASDAEAAEPGNTGTFTISRANSTAAALTVSYTLGGNANNGTDYQTLSGLVTIAAGSTSAEVVVTPIDDSAVEGSEAVILTLAANSAYAVGSPASATVNIADNDSAELPVISLSELDPNASETGPDAGVILFHRSGDTSQTIQLSWTFSGTAQNGVDFPEFPTSGDYPAGSSEADFTITPIDDSLVEGNETITITLVEGPGYRVGTPNTATITIADNDQPPPLPTVTVTASNADAAEPDNAGTITISRSGSTSSPLTVNYSLNGAAQNGTDYQNLSGTVTIASGSGSVSVPVIPIDDSAVEGSETVIFTISAASAYTVGTPGSATVTIADNDQPPPLPTVTVTASDASAGEPNNTGTFTINRTGSTSSPLIVSYTMSGAAQNGTDYSSLSGSVTIAAGSSGASSTVAPIDDSAVEGSETVILTLSTSSAYTVGSPGNATVIIADNDQAPPPLATDFTASPSVGMIPLIVQFTDRSTGNPVSWTWTFGDGSSSTARNPAHTYLLPGNYTATLTVRNSAGATSSKSMVIRATLLPEGLLP